MAIQKHITSFGDFQRAHDLIPEIPSQCRVEYLAKSIYVLDLVLASMAAHSLFIASDNSRSLLNQSRAASTIQIASIFEHREVINDSCREEEHELEAMNVGVGHSSVGERREMGQDQSREENRKADLRPKELADSQIARNFSHERAHSSISRVQGQLHRRSQDDERGDQHH